MDNTTLTTRLLSVGAKFMLVALLAPLLMLLSTPPASACSIIEPYFVEAEDLLAEDFNQPESGLVEAVNEQTFSHLTSLRIDGVYLVETVSTLEASDTWTRGSISAVTTAWGKAPRDTSLRLHDTTLIDFGHTCGPFHGPSLGGVSVRFVTTPQVDAGQLFFRLGRTDAERQASLAVFEEVFGEPLEITRDAAAEAALYEELEAQRPGVQLPAILPGIGGRGVSAPVALLGGIAVAMIVAVTVWFTRPRKASPAVS